jgi:hypothetical protein
MNSKDDPCKKIFQELVDIGCIQVSHFIEESSKCDYFKAVHCGIQYNPEMCDLNEDSIRFSILHEENHNRHPYQAGIFFVFSGLTFVFIIYILTVSLNVNIILSLFALLIIIFCLSIVVKRGEEYECDEFAAKVFRDILRSPEPPSKILMRTLEKMPYKLDIRYCSSIP